MALDRSALDELRIHRKAEEPSASRRWILVAIVVAAIVVVGGLAFARRSAVATVRVETAVEESAGASGSVLNASGYVTARRQATVSSKVTGKVIDVLIEEGMPVQAGQVLAHIDAVTQSAARRLAEAQVAAARSALEETRVRIVEAELDFRRASRLQTEKISAQSDLDRATAQLNALKARLAAQQDELGVAQRQLAIRQQDVDDTLIRAPFAGIVVSKNAQPGEMISPISAGGGFTRTGICTIVDMGSLEVEVDVNEAYINRVHAGQRVVATLDAYPDWEIPAHVIAVIPTADRQKATVKVRIGFDQKDPRILPDMGVKVKFESEAGAAAQAARVSVARSALHRDGDRDVVFIVSSDKVERRAVVVGTTDGDRTSIRSGLAGGETVVVGSESELKDGQRVKIETGETK